MSDWPQVLLSEVTTKVGSGSTPRGGKSAYQGKGIPLIRSMNVHFDGFKYDGLAFLNDKQAEGLKAVEVKANDVLLNITGASIGRVTIAPQSMDGARVNQHVCIIRPDKRLTPSFLRWYLASPTQQDFIMNVQSGVTRQALTKQKILEFEIPLPEADQQKRIVAKIEELFSHIDAGIEALKKAKQLLKKYRQSVLKAAVTGELTKEWREANKDKFEPASRLINKIEDARNDWVEEQIKLGSSEASRLKNKLQKHVFDELDASLMPEEWVSVSLTKLCLVVVDCHNKTAPYVDSGIPLIRTSNIRDGVINFEDKMKYVNQDTYEYWSRRCPPQPADILFTREAPMGETAIIPDNKKVCMGQRMMLLRVIHDLVDVNYLHIALMDPLFQKRVQGFKVGVGVQHLRVGDVEKAVVALPPLAEQKEIMRISSEKLDAMLRLENEINYQLVKSENNRQSVLAAAFSGNLCSESVEGIFSE